MGIEARSISQVRDLMGAVPTAPRLASSMIASAAAGGNTFGIQRSIYMQRLSRFHDEGK